MAFRVASRSDPVRSEARWASDRSGPGPSAQATIGLQPFGLLDQNDRERLDRERERERQDREAERKRAERDRENSYFDQGVSAIDQARYDRAITYFDRVVEMKGTRADGALYWKAFSQQRTGQTAEALATIAELTKQYPSSGYVRQAKALEVEVRASAGQPVRPESQADDDMKVLAIQSLQQGDPEQAIPLLEKLLQGTASPRVKSMALYVLAQSNSPRAREVLKSFAKGGSTPELQIKAINYLGTSGGKESRAVLAEIYSSTTDVDVKRRILRAFMASGDKERLLAVAQTEQNAELRAEAVRQLGAAGATEELFQLYQKETSPDVKRRIIEGAARRRKCHAPDRAGEDREGPRAAASGRPQSRRHGHEADGRCARRDLLDREGSRDPPRRDRRPARAGQLDRAGRARPEGAGHHDEEGHRPEAVDDGR